MDKQPGPDKVQVLFQRRSDQSDSSVFESQLKARVLPAHNKDGLNKFLKISHHLKQIGNYKVQVKVEGQLINISSASHDWVTVTSDLCVSNAATGSNDIYLCPNTDICTSSYFNCARVND